MIVGAGIAGISALSKLVENGYNNTILLEASERIGGRIQTIPFASNFVDLGAQWVHFENRIYEMVKYHDLLDVTPKEFFHGWMMTSENERPTDFNDLFAISYKIFWNPGVCDGKFNVSYGDHFPEK